VFFQDIFLIFYGCF